MNQTSKPHCHEIVRLRFLGSVPLHQQIESLATLGRWAQQQPGFLSRQTLHDEDSGRWIDVVEWVDSASALAAMKASQESAELAAVMSQIENESIEVGHYSRRPDAEGL